MTPADREALLEEEMIILRHSGEIPEIALHTSLFYLEEDEAGPQMTLSKKELYQLYDAALSRAREIVLRDLDPANRDLAIYRGPARSIVNWHRLQSFCRRIGKDCPGFRETVSRALLSFMEREFEDAHRLALRESSVNCSAADIRAFCMELRIDTGLLPVDWTCLCRD